MSETIITLVETVKTFPITEKGNTIHKYFEDNPVSNGIVIMNNVNKPIGLIMRNYFYQMIGTQFGFAIYMNRPVKQLMKTEILCLDISCDLAQFGLKAMNRKQDNLYDFVIIMKDDSYYGIVSISKFLTVISEIKQREIELLNNQQKILKEAHEQEKRFRQEIELKNVSIKNLMNNADQGFLSFKEHLTIQEEYSNACNDIFNKPIAGINFAKLMKDYLDNTQYNLLVNTLDSFFKQEKKVKAKTYLKLLPDEFQADNKFINITYKIISFRHPKTLMVILTNITDKKALEKKNQEEKNRMKLVLSAINNKSEILDSIEEAKQFFSTNVNSILDENQPTKDVIGVLFRVVHTMKGDFALHSFHNTSVKFHIIEDTISKMLKKPENITIEELTSFIKDINFDEIIAEDLSIINRFLGDRFFQSEKNISISYERIEALLRAIEDRFTDDDKNFLESNILKLIYPTLNSILVRYSEYVQALALKLNKVISDFEVTGDIVYINRDLYSKFLKSIIHIFRNIVDHAIEFPEERIEKGKDEQGKIICNISKYDDSFVLEISDDGKGIDPNIIIEKAFKKGIYKKEEIPTLTQNDIINTIFLDSFSTKDKASMLSGRGVGLAAIKNDVEALGGSIQVISEAGKGTTFKIILPNINL